jgi:putative glutamine amidotransferase
MLSLKPLVAVSATTRECDGLLRVRLNESYVAALLGAGVIPLVVPPLDDDNHIQAVLGAVHGLVLTGGEDIDPGHYAAPRHASTHAPHVRRDRFELALARDARRRALPTLAICRGVQLVNVALGGTLVQDIPTERPNAGAHDGDQPRDARTHSVHLEARTRLARALCDGTIRVNSSHHQAVDRVGDGLRVNALAPDGVIEGVEWTGDDWWMIGVQWHPEELVGTAEPWDRRLFEAFANECADWAARSA